MKNLTALALVTLAATATVIAACSSDDPGTGSPATNNPDAGSVTSSSSSTGGNSSSGNAGDDDNDDDDDKGDGGETCGAAASKALGPVDKVSTGEVVKLDEADGAATVIVDATAGGAPEAKNNPRIYMNLGTLKRVDVTDLTAATSKDWDLALKRPVLYTNSGQGGSGQGGAQWLANKDFAAVTKADGTALQTEAFLDGECNAKTDPMGAIETSFTGWYDYDMNTNHLTPFAGTWVVRGGTGKLYKVQILTWYAKADGTEGSPSDSARYTLKVAALE